VPKLSHHLITGVKLGVTRWRTDPKATAIDVGVSSIGQALGWTLFQDFIGIGMKPVWRPGLGHKLSPKLQKRLPATSTTAWTLKVIEIASDATKMPIEGRLYRELGVVPDAVATLVTQPLWSFIEVVEKLIGVIRHPERVNDPDQIADSISSIYGTWTRNGMSMLLIIGGRQMRNKLPHPQTVTIL
jgi:hypothetical protein